MAHAFRHFFLIAFLIGVPTSSVFAWGELGHETVGEIAEQVLRQEAPEALGRLQAVLGVEPLALASAWPDKVRSDERFQIFAPYHYVTIYQDSTRADSKSAAVVLKKFPQILQDPKASRETKMIALRYYLHVVGDIHQPHHVGHEYDRGGNDCTVVWPKTKDVAAHETNLHHVWDEDLIERLAKKNRQERNHRGWYGYKELSQALLARNKDLVSKTKNDKTRAEDWLKDSEQLRKTSGYPDTLPDDQRPYCQRGKKKTPLLLTEKYIEASEKLAETQLVRAGIHLATSLKEIFKEGPKLTPKDEDILKALTN